MKIFNKTILLYVLGFVLIVSTVVYQSCTCKGNRCVFYKKFDAGFLNILKQPITNSTIKYDSLLFYIKMNYYVAECKIKSTPFINTAMATSFQCEYDGLTIDSVKSLALTSNTDFNSNHLKGSNLNDMYDIPSSIIDSLKYNYHTSNDTFFFKLNKAPTLSSTHTFKVKMEMHNSIGYDTILPTLTILP